MGRSPLAGGRATWQRWNMETRSPARPLPVHADAGESLAAVARRMWAHGIGALPVFEHDRLVGVVTERDLVAAIALGAGTDAPVRAHLTSDPAVP
jgi:CBS domain-containing protein